MATATRAARRQAIIKEQMFLWEGKDKSGKMVRGEMRASGEALVQSTLRRQGVLVTKVRKQSFRRGRRITEKDITLFTRQLATMMKSGVPLLQAFDIVGKGAGNPSLGRLLNDIRNDVETGSSLSQAFRRYPQHFDALYCNLVAAGEQAGILDSLLDRLSSYKEKILAIKGKIKSAMFYPIAVVVVAIIITAVLLIFVIPEFKKVFTSFGADLPAPTLFVMALSDFFVAYWYLMFGAAAAAVIGIAYSYKRSEKMQVAFDRLLLRLPVLGPIIRKATIARWTRTLATMFAAGVPLVEALDSVGGASGNYVYRNATRQIQSEVSTGTSLTVAMQNTSIFPTMVVQMVAIGEESGQLDSMLSKVADFFEQEVDDSVQRTVEPARTDHHGRAWHLDRRISGRHVSSDLQDRSSDLDTDPPALGPAHATPGYTLLEISAVVGLVLLVGLLVGSFLNVVIHRLPKILEREWQAQCAELAGEPVAPDEPLSLARPSSRCTHCGHRISALENIPVLSYLVLRGKCRACGTAIGVRYPLVEALTALLSGYAAWRYGATWECVGALIFIWSLIALTFIDVDTQLLPDAITLPLLWAGLLFNTRTLFADLQSAVLGAVAGYLALWSVYWAFKLLTRKEGMGYGDFKLLGAVGAWLGWQLLPFTILASSLVGAVVGIGLMLLAKRGRDVAIPFGPYLAAAGIVALFWGKPLTESYLRLLQVG